MGERVAAILGAPSAGRSGFTLDGSWNDREGTLIPRSGVIETLAGTGEAGDSGDGGDCAAARLNGPSSCALDGAGSLFVADTQNNCVRVVDLVDWTIERFAGTGEAGYEGDGGPATEATFAGPTGLAAGRDGDVFICDTGNHVVRRVSGSDGAVTTVAGTGEAGYGGDGGPATEARLDGPSGVALDGRGGLVICEITGHRVRRVDLESGEISTVAGTGEAASAEDGSKADGAPLNAPSAVAVDGEGNVCVAEAGGNRIVRIGVDGVLRVVSGTGQAGASGDGGPAMAATYRGPMGLSFDGQGDLYVADTGNHAVRVIVEADGAVFRVAGGRRGFSGDGGDSVAASLSRPQGCAADEGGTVYITDTENHRLRAVQIYGAGDEDFDDEDDSDED